MLNRLNVLNMACKENLHTRKALNIGVFGEVIGASEGIRTLGKWGNSLGFSVNILAGAG